MSIIPEKGSLSKTKEIPPSREDLSEVHDSDGAKSLKSVTPGLNQKTLKILLILSDQLLIYLNSNSSPCFPSFILP